MGGQVKGQARAAVSAPPPRPSKIVAIHVNYRSRAAERGATPRFPSYFLKPPSTLSTDGAVVERPMGCELLAFEGEIALVIGRTTRRIDAGDAWGHVAYVAAANDLGVYDLRYADRGSNVRSKGWDGCTPLGPLIPARCSPATCWRSRCADAPPSARPLRTRAS